MSNIVSETTLTKCTGLHKVLGQMQNFAPRWCKNKISSNFLGEFLQNPWTEFVENFANIFLVTRIYLMTEINCKCKNINLIHVSCQDFRNKG